MVLTNTLSMKKSHSHLKTLVLQLALAITIQQATTAQTGSNCTNAVIAVVGNNYVDTIQYTSPSQPMATKAKWYKFTPTQDGVLSIASCLEHLA
jgi:hypothetical protein